MLEVAKLIEGNLIKDPFVYQIGRLHQGMHNYIMKVEDKLCGIESTVKGLEKYSEGVLQDLKTFEDLNKKLSKLL